MTVARHPDLVQEVDTGAWAWLHLESRELSPAFVAPSAEALFADAGFEPIDMDRPLQGLLAVPVLAGDGFVSEADPGYADTIIDEMERLELCSAPGF